jgi:hypothetical protein
MDLIGGAIHDTGLRHFFPPFSGRESSRQRTYLSSWLVKDAVWKKEKAQAVSLGCANLEFELITAR